MVAGLPRAREVAHGVRIACRVADGREEPRLNGFAPSRRFNSHGLPVERRQRIRFERVIPRVVGEQQRPAIERHFARARFRACPEARREVERDFDNVACMPLAPETKITARTRRGNSLAIDARGGLPRPRWNAQSQAEFLGIGSRYLDAHRGIDGVFRDLPQRDLVSAWKSGFIAPRPVEIEQQPVRVLHQRPLGNHAKGTIRVDAATVQVGPSLGRLPGQFNAERARAVHGHVVGAHAATVRDCAERAVERAPLDFVRDARIAGHAQHVNRKRNPRHGATGFDGAVVIRRSLEALARGDAAGVVPVTAQAVAPEVHECVPVLLVAGEPVEFRKRLPVVDGFPAVARHLDDRFPGQRAFEIVSRAFLVPRFVHDVLREVEIARDAGLLVQQHERMTDGHVHLAAGAVAGQRRPSAAKSLEEEVRGFSARVERSFETGIFIVKHQPEHAVIMAPDVPVAAGQPGRLREWSEVAGRLLACDQVAHERIDGLLQSLVMR